jgi:cyclomaltodextrinase / maltogenic alpha-amylase / neopullulanase
MKLLKLIFSAYLVLNLLACGRNSNESKADKNENTDSTSAILIHPEWSKKATIYEVNIRQYTPEGTFVSFEKHLPRLKNMGVKILWLMPVHPIGEKNRKGGEGSYYSVKDYKAINPKFGTMDDFKRLVKLAHDNDMKIIIDWVANHSAFDNEWTKTNPDYYIKDSLGGFTPPAGTDWWDVADLDYSNNAMRLAMIDAMSYWLTEADIDGFRCDVAGMVPTDFWNEARLALDKVKPVFMLAEAEQTDLHEKAFDMTYTWEFMNICNKIAKGEKSILAIDEYMDNESKKFNANDYRMYFTSNHDENSWNGTEYERLGKYTQTFAVLAATIDGMPLVYTGQESAMDYRLKFFEKDSVKWGSYPLLDFYNRMLNLYLSNEALGNGINGGTFEKLAFKSEGAVYGFTRTKGNNQVFVLLNFSDKMQTVELNQSMSGEFSNVFGNDKTILGNGQKYSIKPYGYIVYAK